MKKFRFSKQKFIVLVAAGLVVISLLLLTVPVLATPPSGLTPEPIASGVLQEVIRAKLRDRHGELEVGVDVKNIAMVKYTLAPGGTFGWHQHGGPVWVIVKSGTLSIYAEHDATCTPEVYPAGSGFLDPGNHTHLGINETSEPVVVYATFLLPEGGVTRIDAPDPGLCN